jgi:endonuclease/exonuclease/phosphatase family metal-dependent hydrolase
VRFFPRRRDIPIESDIDLPRSADRGELTLTTYNIWNDSKHAEQRYLSIARLLCRREPDVMVFQEVTPAALDILLAQQWIRDAYARASVVGGGAGNYGMLLLSRVPVSKVTYTRLPSRQSRGFLQAELAVKGCPTVVCCIHLDSGKSSARLRGWQLRRIFRALGTVQDAVVLGDFNMRDNENARIATPYRDVWPTLRPDDDGFTEDTSINLMRYDMKDKHRQVRFDRVLVKGRRWTPTHIELLGTEPIAPEWPRVFPSDHFGVECLLRVRNP